MERQDIYIESNFSESLLQNSKFNFPVTRKQSPPVELCIDTSFEQPQPVQFLPAGSLSSHKESSMEYFFAEKQEIQNHFSSFTSEEDSFHPSGENIVSYDIFTPKSDQLNSFLKQGEMYFQQIYQKRTQLSVQQEKYVEIRRPEMQSQCIQTNDNLVEELQNQINKQKQEIYFTAKDLLDLDKNYQMLQKENFSMKQRLSSIQQAIFQAIEIQDSIISDNQSRSVSSLNEKTGIIYLVSRLEILKSRYSRSLQKLDKTNSDNKILQDKVSYYQSKIKQIDQQHHETINQLRSSLNQRDQSISTLKRQLTTESHQKRKPSQPQRMNLAYDSDEELYMTRNPSEQSSLNKSTSLDNIKPINNVSFRTSFDTQVDETCGFRQKKFSQLPFRQSTIENRLSNTSRLRSQLMKFSEIQQDYKEKGQLTLKQGGLIDEIRRKYSRSPVRYIVQIQMGTCNPCEGNKNDDGVFIEVNTRRPIKQQSQMPGQNYVVETQSLARGYLARKKFNQTNQQKEKFKGGKLLQEVPELASQEALQVRDAFEFEYEQEQKDNLVQRGPVLLPNKSCYIGYWNAENKIEGAGIMLTSQGEIMEGHWLDGKLHGQGRKISKNGDLFQGYWQNGVLNGKGTFYNLRNNYTYRGNFVEGKITGKGKEYWNSGDKYAGEFVNGLKQGKGVFQWANQNKYEGEFNQNKIEGEGTYTWHDGKQYVGQWKKNKMHGKGTFTWPDGRIYIGQYKNDQKHGQGSFQWNDGKKYEGMWKNGRQNGKGIVVSEGKKSRRGEWKDGRRVKWLEQ